MTIESNTCSHNTVTTTRSPGSGYGIHVSAWVQARSDAARSAGQRTGTSKSGGHIPSSLVASHSTTMAAEP